MQRQGEERRAHRQAGARSGRRLAWLVLGLACAVSACRFRYELLDLPGASEGGDAEHGGAAARGGAPSGGNGFGNAGEAGEPGAGGQSIDGGAGGTSAGGSAAGSGGTEQGGAGAISGASGTSGAGNGGTSGAGNGGTSGAGGTSSTAGTSGTGGTSGTAGTSGAGGTAGTSGAGGTAGTSGAGGTGAGELVVTTNADENDAGASVAMPGGTGLSLREAITLANATVGAQTITFKSGVVVTLTSSLPTITQSATILGGVVNAAGVGQDCLVIGAGPTLIDGLAMTGCSGRPLSITGGNDVHISNCSVTQSHQPVEVGTGAGTGAVVGPGNLISGSTGHCVALYNSGALVLDNRIVDCGTDGVFISGKSANSSLIGNLILRATTGIAMGAGATGTVMWFNTIVQSATNGIITGQASANDLRNNILAFNGGYGTASTDAKFSQQDYNLFFGNGSGGCGPCTAGAHSVLLDPKFVNAAGDDYTLQSSSPAINAGIPVGRDRNGAGAGDFNGAAPDLGYWEAPP